MTEHQPEEKGGFGNIRRLVAFLGVLLLLASQFLTFSKPADESGALPPYTWLALIGLFVLVLSQVIRPTPLLERISVHFYFQERFFWIFAALLLSVLAAAAMAFFMVYTRVNYIPVVTIWLLSVACYLYAFLNSNTAINSKKILDWLKANRAELLSVILVMALAAAVRFYKLGEIPRVLDGDEGKVGIFAQMTSSGMLSNPFALWENFGALYLQLINFSMKLFGVEPFALRLLPAIGGVLAIPAVYLLARWIGGQRIALITAFILAASHSHIHFSRIVSVAYIQDTWLVPLELYLFISGLQKRESWRSALGGILLAAHFSVYLTSQVILALVIIYMLIAYLFYRPWFKPRITQAVVFLGGFLILILPSALYAIKHPEEFLHRLNLSGTFRSGYLAGIMDATGQGTVQILFGRVTHAFLSLIYYPALDFYGSTVPMMSMISSTIFLAGLGISLWRLRDPAYLLLNGYFWGATVSIGLFATPPSADTYRMLMALPAAVIMASLGLDKILDLMGLGWKNMRNAYAFSVTAILASLLAFNLWTYYAEFAGQCRFAESLVGRFASYLGREVAGVGNEQRVYLLSDGEYFHGSHPSAFFLSRSRPVINFPESVDQFNPVSGETVIAPPSRILDLEGWADAHPGGQLHYVYDCDTIILLSYRVP